MNSLLPYSLLPAAVGLFGASVAVVRRPSAQVTSLLQHFAAGVVFAVVAVELLPDVIHSGAKLAATAGFAAGVGLMLGLRALAARAHAVAVRGVPGAAPAGISPGMLAGTGIDLLLDGLLIGVGFVAGGDKGVLISIALSVELLALGSALAAELMESGSTRRGAIGTVAGLGLLLPAGALLGSLVLRNATPLVMAGVLAFGAAALLFLAVEELLVEAHEVPETPTATAMFFAGFLVIFLLEWV